MKTGMIAPLAFLYHLWPWPFV